MACLGPAHCDEVSPAAAGEVPCAVTSGFMPYLGLRENPSC